MRPQISSNLRSRSKPGGVKRAAGRVLILCALLLAGLPTSLSQAADEQDSLVSLDFADVELPRVIDTISRMTGKNFIYDDRVRGRVTIVSPTEVTLDQAFAVFESVLKVKGFSLLKGPGDTYKILPIRDIKESALDTVRSVPWPPWAKAVEAGMRTAPSRAPIAT